MTFWLGIYHRNESHCISLLRDQEAERRKMGDKNKLVHNFNSNELENILYAAEHGKLNHNLSPFFTRPAYSGTKASVGGVGECICNECPYYGTTESGLNKKCLFPWFEPQDHDVAAYEYLPCAKEDGLSD